MDLREQIRIAIGGALAAQEGSDGAADAVMEVLAKQPTAAWCATDETGTAVEALGMNQSRRFDTALYFASGARSAPSFADTYHGAMEEVAIWKKRALEAEDLNRKFIAEINGPTHMGEPVQPAPSVPECPYPCGWRNLLKYAIEDGAYLARSINEDEPVTENARAVTMRTVMRLRDVLMAINNAAPEAKSCP